MNYNIHFIKIKYSDYAVLDKQKAIGKTGITFRMPHTCSYIKNLKLPK